MPPATVCHLSAAGTPTASWHRDHAHKYSRGILAWRRGHLSTLWHGDPQQNHFWGRVKWQDCLEPVSNRSLADASAGLRHDIPCERPLGGIPAWRRGHLSTLWHGDHAHKYSRGILAWRRGHLSTLRHGDPVYKGLSAIPACQSISQPTSNRSHPSIPPGPRHGDPTHNALSATPACQSGHLSTLWHGDPQQKHFWGRVTWQDCLEPVSNRSLADA
ncbi:MAG: hypothetical protein PUD74_04625 [Bacteroidales bacterium]|nr:hypothetical protein [Bacteroidales bacterium]